MLCPRSLLTLGDTDSRFRMPVVSGTRQLMSSAVTCVDQGEAPAEPISGKAQQELRPPTEIRRIKRKQFYVALLRKTWAVPRLASMSIAARTKRKAVRK
jgi:hypothetical protein